jgi:hypothetical protein
LADPNQPFGTWRISFDQPLNQDILSQHPIATGRKYASTPSFPYVVDLHQELQRREEIWEFFELGPKQIGSSCQVFCDKCPLLVRIPLVQGTPPKLPSDHLEVLGKTLVHIHPVCRSSLKISRKVERDGYYKV